MLTHGLSGTRTYIAWNAMRDRCRKSRYHAELDITYPDSWNSFLVFLADMGDCPDGMQLDRKDNNGNYTKDNCRWTTPAENAQNRSDTKLTANQVVCIRDALKQGVKATKLSRDYAVSYSCISQIKTNRTWKNL